MKQESAEANNADDPRAKLIVKLASKEHEETGVDEEEEKRKIQELKEGLTSEVAENVSSSSVNKIVGLSSSEIQKGAQEYADKSQKLQEELQNQGQSEEMMHKRRVAGLQRQVEAQKKFEMFQKSHTIFTEFINN